MPTWDAIKDFVVSFGLVKGTFILFFWVAHIYIFRLYAGRLKDRQDQINLLAQENRDYRERFLALLDKNFGYEKKDEEPPPSGPAPATKPALPEASGKVGKESKRSDHKAESKKSQRR